MRTNPRLTLEPDPSAGALSELRDYVGGTALLRCESLLVPVRCLDARQRWGRIDVLVEPVGGTGEQWVGASRLRREGGGA